MQFHWPLNSDLQNILRRYLWTQVARLLKHNSTLTCRDVLISQDKLWFCSLSAAWDAAFEYACRNVITKECVKQTQDANCSYQQRPTVPVWQPKLGLSWLPAFSSQSEPSMLLPLSIIPFPLWFPKSKARSPSWSPNSASSHSHTPGPSNQDTC